MSWSGYKQSFGTEYVTEELIKHRENQIKIHTNPPLPDDVDEYGNLPNLRCGWKQCGMVFETREDLMEHVKQYIVPHKNYINRFHVNCKMILENNPDLTLSEFEEKLKSSYPDQIAKSIQHSDVIAYYNQFQTIFKMHQKEKNVEHQPLVNKETAEILFNFRIESQKKLIKENKIPQQFIA